MKHGIERLLLFGGGMVAAAGLLGGGLLPARAQTLPDNCTDSGSTVTCTFSYTGAAQSWTVPDGVKQATFDLYGAQGGGAVSGSDCATPVPGGLGGETKASLVVTPGEKLQVVVGGAGGTGTCNYYAGAWGGFNGGGSATNFRGGAGGGATDLRSGNFTAAERILVAGGGGGSGGPAGQPGLAGGSGGAGGGSAGGAGGRGADSSDGYSTGGLGGGGGSSSAGGAGGAGSPQACNGQAGGDGVSVSGGVGGAGSLTDMCSGDAGGGGGGGGGYFGGGGGGGGATVWHSLVGTSAGGGGGGGSGYGPTAAVLTSGVQSGDGKAIITYSLDSTAPTASPALSPAANSAGWNNSDVTVNWNWVDNPGGSGIDTANCITSSMSSGEVIVTLAATCTDKAGNAGSASVTVKVDKTPPLLSLSGPTVPASGWLTSAPVTIEVQASDPNSVTDERISAGAGAAKAGPGSQLASERCTDTLNGGSPSSLLDDTLVRQTFLAYPQIQGDGTHVVSCTMTDVAGNTTTQSLTVKIDATRPTIAAAATTAPNAAGWYSGPVTVHFACADAAGGSGLAPNACPADQVLGTEGSAVSSTAQTVTDIAGNTSAASNVVTVKIDKTPPTVQVTGVSNGASYTLGSVPQAGCSTTDTLSGVATQATVTLSGGNASGVGAFTATCSGARDVAGNAAAAVSVHYSVGYTFSGFLAPVNNAPTVNTGKAGRSYPVKFQLTNAAGGYISALSAVQSVTYQAVSCGSFSGGSDPLDAGTAGNSGLQYDPTTHTYTYVWKTPGSAGCYVLTLTLDSGQTFAADFNLN